ncbi:MAG: zinc ribbon domain-containing protein [Acidimicrobiia bacterium]|nr:zinc ribbon domain-containing protein [Acidimicrobiia bacterium]
MPIYEYRCQDCGTSFEKLVRASDADGPACPSCGKAHLQQEFSVFAARGGSSASPAPSPGGCPAGMCRTPSICGRN